MGKLVSIKFKCAIAFGNGEKTFFSATEFPAMKVEVSKDGVTIFDGKHDIKIPMTTVAYITYLPDVK